MKQNGQKSIKMVWCRPAEAHVVVGDIIKRNFGMEDSKKIEHGIVSRHCRKRMRELEQDGQRSVELRIEINGRKGLRNYNIS